MSIHSKQLVKCSHCGKQGEYEKFDSINSDDLELKEKLLSGKLFLHKCPHCNSVTKIITPLLYSDMKENFMIYLMPDKSQDDKLNDSTMRNLLKNGKCECRIVRSESDLLEKITIFDDYLYDGPIEVLKLSIVVNRYQDKMAQISSIKYLCCTEDNELMFLVNFIDNHTETIKISFAEYERYYDTEEYNIPIGTFVEISPFTITNYVKHKNKIEDDMTLKETICKIIKSSNPDDELHFSKMFDDNTGKYEHFLFHKKIGIKIDDDKYYIILSMTDDETDFEVLRFPGNELKELFEKARNKDGTPDEFIKIYFKNKHVYRETGDSEPIDITKYRFNFLLSFIRHEKGLKSN